MSKPIGRPKVDADERKAAPITTCFTRREKAAIQKAAKEAGVSLSDYVRAATVKALGA